tara:strand:- start:356 stop:586 length:231 start_codon:yes stop_codon:yes gene_type:complete
MSIVKTTEDGWDCESLLTEVVDKIESVSMFIYEIKHCVRETDLEYMVVEMKEYLQGAIETLEEIDTDVKYETVDDE